MLISADSCRHWMPDLYRHVTVTKDLYGRVSARLAGLFSHIEVLDAPQFAQRPRFEAALHADVDEAIYIDGDTLFLAPVYELFDVLDAFDIGFAAAPQYLSPIGVKMGIHAMLPSVSTAIPEWNGGLFVARADEKFHAFITDWMSLFDKCVEAGFTLDQAALRAALVRSGLRIATLPNNYNFRALLPQSVAGEVKILHAHGELKRIGRTINESKAIRLYVPKPGDIHGYHPK
jgi:hypothetical protein